MGPKKYDKAFSKTIALALALLLASSTLTGCDLFRPRQEEASNQEIELEAPEPDEDNLGEDLMDDSEVEADVDPDIEDTEQTEEVVEEPETTGSSATTENKDTASASTSQKDQFVDSSNVFQNQGSSAQSTVTTSVLTPESVVQPEKVSNVVYEPVGEQPVAKEEANLIAQPTSTTPTPTSVANKSYSSARFSKKGTYSESKIYKNGYIDVGDVTISNKTFTGDLYIKVPSDTVTLKNVDVQGTIYVNSGSDWVKLYDVHAGALTVENKKGTSRVFASRDTSLDNVNIKTDTVLEEGGLYSQSKGFVNVTVNGSKGTTLTIKNLKLNKLKTVTDCDVVYDSDTIINYAYTYAPTELYGYGQINRLYCYSDGVYYDAKPLYIETGRGYATPSKRTSSGGSDSGSSSEDKKVTLYDINDQYLDIGDTKVVGIDHNGSSLKVTTSNSSVAKVTYSTSKSHITMTGLKPGKATIKVTSSRSGYASSTISFNIIVKDNGSSSIHLSGISNQYMDEGTTRYVSVNTDASRISVSNSNTSVADVTADGFQLKIRAKKPGTTTVKVTASRSGRTSKSTTFKVTVRDTSSDDDYVTINRIDNQIMSNGRERIINVNTNGTSIKASSSNTNVAKVSTRSDDTLIVEAVNPGSAYITVTSSRRGYKDSKTTFHVDVYGDCISAPTVYMNYQYGGSYPNSSWTNQNVVFTLTGYSTNRTAYSYERLAGGSSSQWQNRRELKDGMMIISEEGQKDYYFFTRGSGGDSSATSIYTVRIDKTLPIISEVNNTNGTLTFKVSDNLSGIASVQVKNNSNIYYTPGYSNGTYTFNAPANGRYTIVVTDKAGNRAESSFDMTTPSQPDTTAPVIEILTTSIKQDSWQKEPTEVLFKATDNVTVQSVTVTPSVPLTQNADGTYSFKTSVEGKNTYTITAKDAAGKESTKQITYYLDTIAPVLSDITTQDTTVTIKASDESSGVTVTAVPENDQTKQMVVTDQKNGTFTFTAEQDVNYKITAMDGAGNLSQTQYVMIKSQTTSPAEQTVTISEPTVSDQNTLTTSKVISFNVDANLVTGQSLRVSVQSPTNKELSPANTVQGISNSYSVSVNENGTYTVTASIMNGNAVVKTENRTVKVENIDSTKPTIAVTKNDNGNLEFNVTDENLKEVFVDNTWIADSSNDGKTYTYQKDGLTAGEHTIRAVDKVGNELTQKVNVVLKQQPTISADTTNLVSSNHTNATTTISVDTHGAEIASAQVNKSGASIQSAGAGKYTFTATENGVYTVIVATKDGMGVSVDLTVSGIAEKTTPPTVQVGEHKANDTATQVNVPIVVSDSDNTASEVTLTSDKGTISGSGNNYTLTATENGTYTLTAKDKQGNQATATVYVDEVKGNIQPSISAGTVSVANGSASVKLTVSDNGGTSIVSVTDQNGTAAVLQADGSYLFTASENGSYVITVKNQAGKTASVTVNVTELDKTAPVIAQPNITYSADLKTATITWTVTDAADGNKDASSGIAGVTFAGAPAQTQGSAYQATVSENGNYVIGASDNAGNASTVTASVTGIDKTAPSIQVTSKNDSWKQKQVVTFSVTDENSSVASVQVIHNGKQVSLSEGNGYSFTATENGTYTIMASDTAGNAISKDVAINRIDVTKPSAPSLKNADKAVSVYNAQTQKGEYQAKPNTTFTVGYTKAAAGESPVSVQVKIDKEQTFKTLSGDTPKLTLAEGTHTVVLKTVDAAGNESAPVTYKITVKAQSAVTTTPKDPEEKPAEEKEETESGNEAEALPQPGDGKQESSDPQPTE